MAISCCIFTGLGILVVFIIIWTLSGHIWVMGVKCTEYIYNVNDRTCSLQCYCCICILYNLQVTKTKILKLN